MGYSSRRSSPLFLTHRARSDFTKQYNRLRQHIAVHGGAVQGAASATNQKASVAPLPAVNHPRHSTLHAKDKATTTQLAALSKYSSRISKIDQPYAMGVGVNRKGPSSYANAKDKSDRATSEQVLDPRTRVILFKMIGRGLIQEVNGCISTSKEVRDRSPLDSLLSHPARQTYTTHSPRRPHTWRSRSTRRLSLSSKIATATSRANTGSGEGTVDTTLARWYGYGPRRKCVTWSAWSPPEYVVQSPSRFAKTSS